MSEDRFARVEALFEHACALPPDQWAALLEREEPDPAIRAEVWRLLELDLRERSCETVTFDQVLARARPSTPGVEGEGDLVGPYRLVRELGAGGMGRVFLAEREVGDALQRVALKLLHGLPGERERERLARERSLLAGLHHPYIAGLVDGGQTADGQPWLAMAYVDGVPLHDHLSARSPSIEQRLALFGKCCEAVQHAHQRLVLHRDIKPGNILVGGDGTPVLLDFGLGMLVEEQRAERTTTLAFTPGYAAPEQMHGLPATTATDVFGLGAVLFDLLADVRLSSLRRGDTEVPSPALHIADPARRRTVRGDLERIVKRATARDPAQRYPSVAMLAEDVARYRRGEVISAGPDSIGYRARKFVGRHRWGVAATAAAVALAAVFVWRLAIERDRAIVAERLAQREVRSAEAARGFLVSVLSSADPDVVGGRALTVDSLLETAADELRRDTARDPATRAAAWLAVADVYANLRNPRASLDAADQAQRLLPPAQRADPALQARLAELRGTAYSSLERHDQALAQMRRLLALRARPGTSAFDRASAEHAYAVTAVAAGRYPDADAHLRRALELLDRSRASGRERKRLDVLLDAVHLHWQQLDLEGAERELTRARRLAERILEKEDARGWLRLEHATARVRMDQSRYAEALAHGERALAATRALYGERSMRVASLQVEQAGNLHMLGRDEQAIAMMSRARELMRSLDADPVSFAQTDVELGTFLSGMGRYQEAEAVLGTAITALPEDDPAQVAWRFGAYKVRANVRLGRMRYADALADAGQAAMLALRSGRDSVEMGQVQRLRARVLLGTGETAGAGAALDEAGRLHRKQGIGPETPAGIDLAALRAELAHARGDQAQAAREIAQALRFAGRRTSQYPPASMVELRITSARIALAQQRDGDALQSLAAAAADLHRAPELLRESLRRKVDALRDRLQARAAASTPEMRGPR